MSLLRDGQITSLEELAALDPEALLKRRNVGVRTLTALLYAAEDVLMLRDEHQTADLVLEIPQELEQSDTPRPSTLIGRWLWLRERVAQAGAGDRGLSPTGLRARTVDLLLESRVKTLGQLLALDPVRLLQRSNVGRVSVTGLLDLAERSACAFVPELSSVQHPTERSAVAFTDFVHDTLDRLGEKGAAVVQARLTTRVPLQVTGERFAVSRERVRQLERKFINNLQALCEIADHVVLRSSASDPCLLASLGMGARDPLRLPGAAYVHLGRVLALRCSGLSDLWRAYSRAFESLARIVGETAADLGVDDLSDQRIIELAAAHAPLLLDYEAAELTSRIRKQALLGAHAKRSLRKALIREVRRRNGACSIAFLKHRLAAQVDDGPVTDSAVRAAVHRTKSLWMPNHGTVAARTPLEPSVGALLDLASEAICASERPLSIVLWMRGQPSAPCDAVGLGMLLSESDRVRRVGRLLYVGARSRFRRRTVADLIQRALAKERRPWSRRELLRWVRRHRDLVSNQVDASLAKVPGLVRYSRNVFGLAPVGRSVMLQLLAKPRFILDSLAGRPRATHEEIWLDEAGDEDRLTPAERGSIMAAAASWRRLRVVDGNPITYVVGSCNER